MFSLFWFWQSLAVGRGRVLVASTYRHSEKDVEKGFKAQKYDGDILEDLDVIFFVKMADGLHTYKDIVGYDS